MDLWVRPTLHSFFTPLNRTRVRNQDFFLGTRLSCEFTKIVPECWFKILEPCVAFEKRIEGVIDEGTVYEIHFHFLPNVKKLSVSFVRSTPLDLIFESWILERWRVCVRYSRKRRLFPGYPSTKERNSYFVQAERRLNSDLYLYFFLAFCSINVLKQTKIFEK